MKGVLLCGGTGSRLNPLTKVTNKHLLPVGNIPMVLHNVYKLKEAGINEIIVVTGTEHMGDMISLLGSGKDYNCEFTYKVQDKPDGIAGALRLCKHFVGTDSCIVILGDNIFNQNLTNHINNFTNGCKLLLKEVQDPERFGVAVIENGKLTKVIEKPKIPPSNLCVTGIYIFDHDVFEITNLKMSERGEYEITDIINVYINNAKIEYSITDEWWTDAGTFPSYARANELAFKHYFNSETNTGNR